MGFEIVIDNALLADVVRDLLLGVLTEADFADIFYEKNLKKKRKEQHSKK
ncbi:hypothetical protein [Vibrio sp. ES.051]|nr:hypothetical protein [Vibrio sp. ES.051]